MEKIEFVVYKLSDYLLNMKNKWAITGGCNLYLKKCISYTNDIDIITSKEGVEEFIYIFEGYHKKLEKTQREKIKSYHYLINIDGIDIELMGEPENKIHNNWIKNDTWTYLIEDIYFYGKKISLAKIDYEFFIYSFIGNDDRAKLIRKCMSQIT